MGQGTSQRFSGAKGRPEENSPFIFEGSESKMSDGRRMKTQGKRQSLHWAGKKVSRQILPGCGLSRSGKAEGQARFFLPRKPGLPVVFAVVGDDFKGIGPGQAQAGKDIGQETGNLGERQEGFFFENFSRIFCRKAWATKTWSMWRCQPCQERCS